MAPDASPGSGPSAAEPLLHEARDGASVGTAAGAGHHELHDRAHLARRGGAGLGDRRVDDRRQLIGAELLREVALDQLGLGLLAQRVVLAPALAEARSRLVAALALAAQERDLVLLRQRAGRLGRLLERGEQPA